MSVRSFSESDASAISDRSDAIPFTVASRGGGPELNVIVPTCNERDNIEPLQMRLEAALCSLDWEVIYVDDDSPDGTADKIRSLAQADARIRCAQRIGRRGLSTAAFEGMLSSSAPYLAVIDADLQHDEAALAQMLGAIKVQDLDIVIGMPRAVGSANGTVAAWQLVGLEHFSPGSSSAELNDPM